MNMVDVIKLKRNSVILFCRSYILDLILTPHNRYDSISRSLTENMKQA